MANNTDLGKEKREQAFLAELGELTRKHRLVVCGCGCCGSPQLEELSPEEEGGHYGYDGGPCDFEWITSPTIN